MNDDGTDVGCIRYLRTLRKAFFRCFRGATTALETFGTIANRSYPEGPPSLIATLPPELLGEVFLWCRYSHEHHPFPMRWLSPTRVCRYWREVALGTPLLWRDIDFIPWKTDWSLPVLQEMLRRSGQTPLRLGLEGVELDDIALNEIILAELHRMEALHIQFYYPSGSSDNIKQSISDAPILRSLNLYNEGVIRANAFIPFVSPEFPLKFLESIHLMRYAYADVSLFFRPTMKHLSLDRCEGGTVADFLHALTGMPLLEVVKLSGGFASPLVSKLPFVTLSFLRNLRTSNNDGTCAQILDHLSFPSSTLLEIVNDDFYPDTEDAPKRLCAAIASKAAGYNVLGTVIPVHTLHVRTVVHERDTDHIIFIWTDDPSIHVTDNSKCRGSPIPTTVPFCQCSPSTITSALDALQLLCSTASNSLGSVRTLIVSNEYEGNPWEQSCIPPRIWSGSFASLVGLESLYLDCIVWDGLDTTQAHATGGEGNDTGSTRQPFPHLRLLSLSRIRFRYSHKNPKSQRYGPNFIYTLQNMLDVRKQAGMELRNLIVSNVLNFDQEDLVMLRTYVGEIEWDGCVRYTD